MQMGNHIPSPDEPAGEPGVQGMSRQRRRGTMCVQTGPVAGTMQMDDRVSSPHEAGLDLPTSALGSWALALLARVYCL